MSPSAEQAGTSNDTSGQAGVGMAKGENARLRIRDQPAVRVTWGFCFSPTDLPTSPQYDASGTVQRLPSDGLQQAPCNRYLLYMLRAQDTNNDRRDDGCRVTVKMTLGIHSDFPMFCGARVAPLWRACGAAHRRLAFLMRYHRLRDHRHLLLATATIVACSSTRTPPDPVERSRPARTRQELSSCPSCLQWEHTSRPSRRTSDARPAYPGP
jgi:hypothetical protein